MPKASKPSSRKAVKGKVKSLSPAESGRVKGGKRTEAQINSGGTNPLTIARDRALGNG